MTMIEHLKEESCILDVTEPSMINEANLPKI